jgi:hypothetical protein
MLNTYVDSYKDGLVKENRSIDCYWKKNDEATS